MTRRWTKEEAWTWYNSLPWLRGCNFIGSDCANRYDMWQSYDSDAHKETASRELALASKIGFNTVRFLIEFDVWAQEHDSFMDILEWYIAESAKNGLLVMLCLANETMLNRGDKFEFKKLGPQSYALGYHQGRWPLTPEQLALTPFHPLEKDGLREQYLEMVREVVTKYKDDTRVICWNVFNEPGITIGTRTLDLVKLMFKTVRECDPSQPLAADMWHTINGDKVTNEIDLLCFELSDVISYHSYTPYKYMIPMIEVLKELDRPILMTEWLNRINNSNVDDIYPLMYLENIANWCWGFVVGKTQTNEPWDSLWIQYENGTHPDLDFTKWQHDLFRPNLKPYNPHEIETIERYNALAKARDEKKLKK